MRRLDLLGACLAALRALPSAVAQSGTNAGVPGSVATRTSTAPATDVTNIPVFNATVDGMPANTTVVTIPDPNTCNYTTGNLYCFPDANAFVSMTGWTRFFYNRDFGLLRNSGLVDLTMYFATDDRPAATWLGVQNTGDIPINVNISWFTSTLAPQATQSVAEPYYFYVRPNSAVYNALATISSRGPVFYAVQTPLVASSASPTAAAGVAATATSPTTSGPVQTVTQTAAPASSTEGGGGSQSLSSGAKAGIALAAIALFFTLVILAVLFLLYQRRQKFAQLAAEASEKEKQETAIRNARIPGNLYSAEEWEVAGLGIGRGGGRPGGLGAVGVLSPAARRSRHYSATTGTTTDSGVTPESPTANQSGQATEPATPVEEGFFDAANQSDPTAGGTEHHTSRPGVTQGGSADAAGGAGGGLFVPATASIRSVTSGPPLSPSRELSHERPRVIQYSKRMSRDGLAQP